MIYSDPVEYSDDMRRSDYTMVSVKKAIADLIFSYKSDGEDLLEVGVNHGTQTIYYHSKFISPGRLEGYDWKDFREKSLQDRIIFSKVDIEVEKFPSVDASFDVVVCNQVFEHLKNIFVPLTEIWRVLRIGGLLVSA